MFLIHKSIEENVAATIAFAKEHGCFDKRPEDGRSNEMTWEEVTDFLAHYGTKMSEGTFDPTRCIVQLTVAYGLGDHSYGVSWWFRRNEKTPTYTEDQVGNLVKANNDSPSVLIDAGYYRFMVGGMVYHPASNGWNVHT